MISLQPLAEADISTVDELAHWSKLSLTINRLLWNDWPAVTAQRSLTRRAIEGSFRDSNASALKAVDDISGEILGYIVLTRPRSKKAADAGKEQSETAAAEPLQLPQELNDAVLTMVGNAVGEIQKEMVGTDYIEMTFMVVKQGFRNKGIGRQLMGAGFELAKSQGVPLFTVAEPAARGFFEKLGMRETKHVDMDLAAHARPYEGFGMFRLTGVIWSPTS